MPNIAGASGYNYQAPVLGSTIRRGATAPEQDARPQGPAQRSFNLQSTRTGNENFFGFVDTTDTLGINTNINWSHRFNQHVFVYTGYRFSRSRTLIVPNFAAARTSLERRG